MPINRIRHERVIKRPRSTRAWKPKWYDPFPWIQGSVPEKMVMAELARRGIYFEHTPPTNPLPPPVDRNWEPDFLLPQYKIWIEVQGAYFHSKPAAIQSDAWRFAAIESVGWRPLFWWDYDIETRLVDLMNEVPEFYVVNRTLNQGYRKNYGLPFWEGNLEMDHLAGLRKALAQRAKPRPLIWRRRGSKRVRK